jgi:hypothetical protein
LAALLGFLANPVANIARAPAMAGLDPLNVNDVGDEAGADGGLDSIEFGKRSRPYLQNRSEGMDFA